MKNTFLTLVSVFTFISGVNAQISLIGAATNLETGKIDLVEWQALDSLSVSVVPTILDGYYFATSAFDAYNGNYIITGISGDSSGLYAYNAATGAEDLTTGSLYSNISEFDMSTGKLYNLIMETEEYISIYEFDLTTNLDTLIGTIYEPGAIGIVADAIGFDSNNGIVYYVGYTNDPALCLYAIPVRDSVFSYTKTILNTTEVYNNITSVNFDNVNEIIYALNDTYDSLFNFTGRYIVEIDKSTGDIIVRGDLAEFPIYVGGSSSFDQITGTYLLAAIDTTYMLKMVAFNTATDTYVSGFMPGNVSEIVCDNSQFAKLAYETTAIQQESTIDLKLYPNPVSDYLRIEHALTGPVTINIASSDGKLVFTRSYTSANVIDMNLASLSPGLYVLNLVSGAQSTSETFLVQ